MYQTRQATALGYGTTQGERFGESVAGAGDVNGDGYGDVIVGASERRGASTTSGYGTAYLFFGGPSGSTPVGMRLGRGPDESDEYGLTVAGAGDVNADGFADVLVGSPQLNGNGKAYLYLGSARGPVTTPARVFTGAMRHDRLGIGLAGIGDMNGDGYGDIAIGSPAGTIVYPRLGHVDVYFGSATGVSAASTRIVPMDLAYVEFGQALSSAGDVDNDGDDELLIGSPYSRAAFLVMGNVGTVATTTQRVMATTAFHDQFGYAVDSPGDINGDGRSDIVVGSPGWYAPFGNPRGAAFVIPNGTGSPVQLSGTTDGELFGISVACYAPRRGVRRVPAG